MKTRLKKKKKLKQCLYLKTVEETEQKTETEWPKGQKTKQEKVASDKSRPKFQIRFVNVSSFQGGQNDKSVKRTFDY